MWNRNRRERPGSRDWWPRWDDGAHLMCGHTVVRLDEAVHQKADTERNVKLTRG